MIPGEGERNRIHLEIVEGIDREGENWRRREWKEYKKKVDSYIERKRKELDIPLSKDFFSSKFYLEKGEGRSNAFVIVEEDGNDGMPISDPDHVAEVLERYWGDLFLERNEMNKGKINILLEGHRKYEGESSFVYDEERMRRTVCGVKQ